jgi:23S rRNA pseudouridine2605 synthase
VPGLFPVGRLDITTEGLLLLTNDGAFAERVTHPRYEVPRVYHAKVHKVPDAETLERLRRGVRVEGELLTVDRVRVLEAENNAWLELTLHEGKKHEVRRLLEAVGHPVSKLRRVGIGPLSSRGLKPGQFRSLTPAEIRGLIDPPGGHVKTAPSAATRRPQRPRRPPAGARRPASPSRRPPGENRRPSREGARPSRAGARPPSGRPPSGRPPQGRPPRRRT